MTDVALMSELTISTEKGTRGMPMKMEVRIDQAPLVISTTSPSSLVSTLCWHHLCWALVDFTSGLFESKNATPHATCEIIRSVGSVDVGES
jgi:hypothetical protein